MSVTAVYKSGDDAEPELRIMATAESNVQLIAARTLSSSTDRMRSCSMSSSAPSRPTHTPSANEA